MSASCTNRATWSRTAAWPDASAAEPESGATLRRLHGAVSPAQGTQPTAATCTHRCRAAGACGERSSESSGVEASWAGSTLWRRREAARRDSATTALHGRQPVKRRVGAWQRRLAANTPRVCSVHAQQIRAGVRASAQACRTLLQHSGGRRPFARPRRQLRRGSRVFQLSSRLAAVRRQCKRRGGRARPRALQRRRHETVQTKRFGQRRAAGRWRLRRRHRAAPRPAVHGPGACAWSPHF